MSREKLINIGTVAWALALVVAALLYVAPAVAGGGIDCQEACSEIGYCDDAGGCMGGGTGSGDICVVPCREGGTARFYVYCS